jgi:hypothetical protein
MAALGALFGADAVEPPPQATSASDRARIGMMRVSFMLCSLRRKGLYI